MSAGRPRQPYLGDDHDASCALLAERLNQLSASKRRQSQQTGVAPATLEGYLQKVVVPSEVQTAKIDRALDRALHAGRPLREITTSFYPTTQGSTLDRLNEVLKPAGFSIDGQPNGELCRILWMHKLREPNLVHGVFTLAAAAAMKEGVAVRLLLDDTEVGSAKERTRLVREFRRAVGDWLDAVGVAANGLTVNCYSEIAASSAEISDTIAKLSRFLNEATKASEFIDAAKVLRWDLVAKGTVEVTNGKKAGAFATPFWNFLILEDQVRDLASESKEACFALTLGGQDEGTLWRIWHRGAPERLSDITGHLFLKAMPLVSERPVWDVDALRWPGERERLARFLQDQCRTDRALLLWLHRAGVMLAAQVGVQPSDPAQRAFFGSSPAKVHREADKDLLSTSRSVAEAVMEWFSR